MKRTSTLELQSKAFSRSFFSPLCLFLLLSNILPVYISFSTSTSQQLFWVNQLTTTKEIVLTYLISTNQELQTLIGKHKVFIGKNIYIKFVLSNFSLSNLTVRVLLIVENSEGRAIFMKRYLLRIDTGDLINSTGSWVGKLVFLLPSKPLWFANRSWVWVGAIHNLVAVGMPILNESEVKDVNSTLFEKIPAKCRKIVNKLVSITREQRFWKIYYKSPIVAYLASMSELDVQDKEALSEVLRKFNIGLDRVVCFKQTYPWSSKPLSREDEIRLLKIMCSDALKALNSSPYLYAIRVNAHVYKVGKQIVGGLVYPLLVTNDCRPFILFIEAGDSRLVYDSNTGVLLYGECGLPLCKTRLDFLPLDVNIWGVNPFKLVKVKLINASITFNLEKTRTPTVVQGANIGYANIIAVIALSAILVVCLSFLLRRKSKKH